MARREGKQAFSDDPGKRRSPQESAPDPANMWRSTNKNANGDPLALIYWWGGVNHIHFEEAFKQTQTFNSIFDVTPKVTPKISSYMCEGFGQHN
jgi:hypothetical protein